MINQTIIPDKKLFFTGETVTFKVNTILHGRAFVRTNIGGGSAKIAEQIEKTELNRTLRGSDWRDFDMNKCPDGTYTLTLPLTETGVFEAKCGFITADSHELSWADGNNFKIKVSSFVNVSGNGIYCCFVRQFGKWMYLPHSPEQPDFSVLDQNGFTVIPPSGTFRNVIANLDHIFDTLNCRILQLLPIHPVPTSYGRMGRYGSPFAATDYFAVEPALADFDTSATPMEQFVELIDAVHARGGRIFMDIPVNHTGWASKLQNEHPDYFIRKQDKEFVSPGAWGTVWEDLCQLNYQHKEVNNLMAKVFLFWCKRGVDGFRCDAGYMVPQEAWKYIIAKVRKEYPDTTFLLEGLGGPPAIQKELLENEGLDWGYSELFQNYTRDAISAYYPQISNSAKNGATLINFAETHDNSRLAAGGKTYAKLRFLVNALLSVNGTFGFANGAEYFAVEKIDVHQCGALNFGSVDNLCTIIGKLNILIAVHPAFSHEADVDLIQHGPGNVIAARRHGKNIPELLVLLNLDCSNPADVHFPAMQKDDATDLLTGKSVHFYPTGDDSRYCHLAPGEGLCLSFDDFIIPDTIVSANSPEQHLAADAMAYNAALNFVSMPHAAQFNGKVLCSDPEKFVSTVSGIFPAPVCHWYFPQDVKRTVIAAPGDLLMIHSHLPFIAELHNASNETVCKTGSLFSKKNEHFALLRIPRKHRSTPEELYISFTAFDQHKVIKQDGTLLQLAEANRRQIRLSGHWHEAADRFVFGSNEKSSYAMFSAQWGKITGKYDAILAINSEDNFPAEHYVMFSSCRAWLIVDGYSQELTEKSLETYSAHPGNRAKWEFLVPDGHGGRCSLGVEFRMATNANTVELKFHRKLRADGIFPSAELILRPDLEDRINHSTTRACDGPEQHFVNSIRTFENGFEFQPDRRCLKLQVSSGKFHSSPQWRYMVDLPQERYYGMHDKTDLFSPGYFSIPLAPDGVVRLTASTEPEGAPAEIFPEPYFPVSEPPENIASDALKRFIVRRDDLSTVIAGYPWFLDWGRDTLIVLRGLIKFPEFRPKAAEIIRRFAAFEKSGTIPNMICGNNDSNRDTSDAPLYLIAAVSDYIHETGNKKFLDSDCSGRTLKEIISSIVENFSSGTPNGIKMDPYSGLLFSPSHFSWMDTNYPAGTPREGYPVEIQSLWFAALNFTGNFSLAETVRKNIEKLYFRNGIISDCLHCNAGTPATLACADDHLRCNILTTITFNAVRDPEIQQRILNSVSKLIIPGAIRTLDDCDVTYQLPVSHYGQLLNDPAHPYYGHYCGPEDTSRKPAYHNGTAWCWPFPSYCEALYMIGGEKSRKRALALLMSAADWMENGVIGELPEVLDGNKPHRNGGCLAQAWSISEFYRVFKILKKDM